MLQIIVKISVAAGLLVSALTYSNWLYDRTQATPDRLASGHLSWGERGRALLIVVLEGLAWGVAILLSPFAYLGDFLAWGRTRGARPPVLLIHGYLHNRLAWLPHGIRLRRAGWTALYSINLWPLDAPMERFAEQVRDAVERICRETGSAQIDLVCHSMGGVVARSYIQRLGGHERVAHLVTLGSPHHGTRVAPLGLWPNALGMAIGAEYTTEMDHDPEGLRGVAAYAIYSAHDNIVIPPESAALPAPAESAVLDRLGHATLLWSPRVWAHIETALLTPVD